MGVQIAARRGLQCLLFAYMEQLALRDKQAVRQNTIRMADNRTQTNEDPDLEHRYEALPLSALLEPLAPQSLKALAQRDVQESLWCQIRKFVSLVEASAQSLRSAE
eukprot:12300917-Karenia_brevis.AAC.1